MNEKQRLVLFTTAAILVVMLLFPPFQSIYLQGVTTNEGYSFILSAPTYEISRRTVSAQVNRTMLLIQFVVVTTAAGLLYFALSKVD